MRMRTAYTLAVLGFLGSLVVCLVYLHEPQPLLGGLEQFRGVTSTELDSLTKQLDKVRQLFAEFKHHSQELRRVQNQSGSVGPVAEYSWRKLEKAEDIISQILRESQKPNLQDAITDPQRCGKAEPTHAYEKVRRKVDKGLTNIWYYLTSQLAYLRKSVGDEQKIRTRIDEILEDGGKQMRSIVTDVYNLSRVDGYSSWRQKEAKELSDIVQNRLRYLQNPKNCSSAKKIVCNLNVQAGFGSQSHHVGYCLMFAYATGRTLILESKGWHYAQEGWEKFMLPLSDTCNDRYGATTGRWGVETLDRIADIQVIDIPVLGYLTPRPTFVPSAIPEDLSQRLMKLHGHPFGWWAGQIMAYIQRPQPSLQKYIDDLLKAMRFTKPIVGVQVRRTDKLVKEAAFHAIDEYMFHVEEFYQRLEMVQEVPVKRVYLATDETGLLLAARKKYPGYEFVSNAMFSSLAGLKSRFSEDSLRGIITDLYLLSRTDFLVCTFTSNICRQAYELMQYHHPDASTSVRSLDGLYHYGGVDQIALYAHDPRSSQEIELRPGDKVHVCPIINNGLGGYMNNGLDGYTNGINLRVSQTDTGWYPSYKAEDIVHIAKMPTFPGVKDLTL